MYMKWQPKSKCLTVHLTFLCLPLLAIVLTALSVGAQVLEVNARYGTGVDPTAMVAADFDGDEHIDLAIAHRDAGEIWIFSNDGVAGFSHSRTLTECEPENLYVADLNGDSYNDLMWFDEPTVLSPAWGVTMYFNNGDGTFYQGFKEAMGSKAMCAGYFDADGVIDVAVYIGTLGDQHVALLLGTGDGGFAAPVNILPGIVVSRLATADLDHDGDDDIIVGTSPLNQSLLNNGDGTFAEPLPSGGFGSAPQADIDGDDYLDMVGIVPATACNFAPGFALSEHDGTFSQSVLAWETAGILNGSVIRAADFNGDGFGDIAWHPRDQSQVTIGLNNGRSVFSDFEYIPEVAAGGAEMMAADLDGDGDLDLAITALDDTLTIALSQAAQHMRRILVPGDFPTVQDAVDYAWNLDTIIVEPGIYYENIDFGGKNIVLISSEYADGFSPKGQAALSLNSYSTIIDGGDVDRVFMFDNSEDERSVIAGFIIQNGNAAGQGGGVYCDDNTAPTIIGNIFRENYASNGGGAISLQDCSANIKNNLIINNSSGWWGGGVFIGGHLGDFINNTIYDNTTVNGGGGLCFARGTPTICNNIFWGNSSTANGQQVEYIQTTSPTIEYSVVEGGWTGEGNIDTDPMFVDPANGDFNLLAGSPCINAGDPDGPLDPDGTRADIGACYYPHAVDVEDDFDDALPASFELSQNYPNPFNPTTMIEYRLANRSHVIIEVFNVLGQKIRQLVDRQEPAGSYTVAWDGTNLSGRAVSTGVYLYRFQAGDYVATKKMLLLK